ncbi:MspA family porin [Rhodococcus spelaei]|uniref:MspA family porin n=1 Tax=Rhodococcus spelaei TaxID=2546320 RepID=A0A541BAB9_9NOCA|nr:MspA family porin [Rhodococcus spelaei]TQF69275.1 MspA family porin [Rhodococcus spelaei]
MNASKTGLRRGLQIAASGAAAAVALGFLSVGAANADTLVPLPDGSITQILVDGTVVTITRTGESANISPSLGATPLHRNAWVSGSAKVELSGPGGGTIQPGYIVGCQLTLGGKAGADSNMTSNYAGTTTTQSGKGSGTVSIGPGQAVDYKILDLEVADAFGAEQHRNGNPFKNKGSVTWADSTMAVNGCAGYAQARSYVKVIVSTANVQSTVTLWGQPFSLG